MSDAEVNDLIRNRTLAQLLSMAQGAEAALEQLHRARALLARAILLHDERYVPREVQEVGILIALAARALGWTGPDTPEANGQPVPAEAAVAIDAALECR